MTLEEEFEAVRELMNAVVKNALVTLSERYGETPLEAAEHLQLIIAAALEEPAGSLHDRARANPVLMADLLSGQRHTEVAKRWNVDEITVRRARAKLRNT